MMMNGTALNILHEGCKLPFLDNPGEASFLNNKFIFRNSEVAKNFIEELLSAGTLPECGKQQKFVNLLSDSINLQGKKRLISENVSKII